MKQMTIRWHVINSRIVSIIYKLYGSMPGTQRVPI